MATNKNVIVLVPNGRRQNVAVTPNTTILQVIEEVCQKHGFNVNDYDLKHFNRVLDPNAILRFTGLANNAQLEMIPCTKVRSMSNVTIGIQLESGERLMSEFTPNVTLAEILQNLNLDKDLEQIILIYMHQEIFGVEALNNTTLKSLGINNGKAVFRLMRKNPQSMHTNIPSQESNENMIKCKIAEIDENVKKNKRIAESEQSLDVSKRSVSTNISKMETRKVEESEICSRNKEIKMNNRIEEEKNEMKASTSTGNCEENFPVQSCNMHTTDDLNDIEFLGERNALVFNQATVQGVSRDELPDEFYDLTVEDAKILLRDIKRYREELEDAPFLTNTLRQLNEEKRKLSQLKKYHYTIIRIQFPDQFVLQGLFKPTETVQAIKDFIKTYLIDANSDFIIFTTPPKQVLNPNAHLIDENLVPCAVVHYSGSSALRPDVKEKFTTLEKVALQVAKVRTSSKENQIINEDITSDTRQSKPVCTNIKNESKSKIPKWFNPSLK